MKHSFDAIVIGAGQAGPPLAARLAGAGMRVAIVERKFFGGTCVNTGCMPTKAMIASAYAAQLARRGADYGVLTGGAVAVDMAAVKSRKERIVADSRAGVERWMRGLAGASVFTGHARFESADTLRIAAETGQAPSGGDAPDDGGDTLLSAPRIFLDVGGRAAVPEMPGVREIRPLTNTSILELDQVPRHLVVVGGSYIGLEFAQMMRRFGAAVTVVEKGKRLVVREDEDVSDAIRGILEAEGIAVRLGAECIRFRALGDEVAVGVDCANGAPEVIGSHVLLAVGRRPNTDDLGLDRAGVALDARGYVVVDDRLQSSVPGIWALGDCNGRGAFTHTAYDDHEIVAANLLEGASRSLADRIEAYALFIDPPLGRVGLTESQARKAGHAVRVGRRPMTRVGRAVEKGETQGFMKIVVDAGTDAILGAAILGTGGDEAIHAMLDTMAAGRTADALRKTMHIHPTVCELIPTVLGELHAAP